MTSKKSKQQPGWVAQERTIYISAALIFFATILLASWFLWNGFSSDVVSSEMGTNDEEVQKDGCEWRHRLNGTCLDTPSYDDEVVVVTVENHPDARPQSGMADADVVYEFPVEANYTRFLLVFPATAEVEKIGPVRSVRPYFIDVVQEYGQPLYMHVGGSPDGLSLIHSLDIRSVNEFYHGWLYWRSTDRFAPHNVYTSSDLWKKGMTENPIETDEADSYESWLFAEEEACTEDCIDEIEVSFLSPSFDVIWLYRTSTMDYIRYQGTQIHSDQKGIPLLADTLVIMETESEVLDDVGRLAIDMIGSGRATIFRDGKMIEGEWKKEARESRTRFYQNGHEIALKPGKIWIEVLNQRASWSHEMQTIQE